MDYKAIATEAAEYERQGNLRMAMLMWQQAAKVANNSINQAYAQNRADFCGRWGNDD